MKPSIGKKEYNTFHKIENRILIAILMLLFCTLFIQIAITSSSSINKSSNFAAFSIAYMEDASGTMTLEEVLAKEIAGSFMPMDRSTLSKGQSRSTWWVRIKLESLPLGSGSEYISISNPTVEKVVLYLPVRTEKGVEYKTFRSGWGFHGNIQDEGYTYPLFKITDNRAADHFAYLRLNSHYTQNYNIQILQEGQLNNIRQKNLLLRGILFGVLLVIGINNFIKFFSLKDWAYLYYASYIFFTIVYQLALLGVYRIFAGRFAEVLIAEVATIGIFVMASAQIYLRSFFNTKKYFPKQDRVLKLIVLLFIVAIVLMFSGFRYEASIICSFLPTISTVYAVWVVFYAFRTGFRQAKYYLVGNMLVLLGIIFFTLRVWGLIPNNDLSLNIFLMTVVAEAIFSSAALVDREKVLKEEKETALKNAEESSKSNELAFLQAQIKPHFLYNGLNIIAALCRMDGVKARELILDLASYLHHTFDFRNLSKYIPFEDELEFIKAYVRIEQARFRDKLKVEYELDDTSEFKLPPLILQPLIENAIRHGIRKKGEGGTVVLRVKNQEHYLIEVEDDGAGMSEEQLKKITSEVRRTGSGVGMININRRLQMLYGTGLSVKSRPGEGTKITIVIPKVKDNKR